MARNLRQKVAPPGSGEVVGNSAANGQADGATAAAHGPDGDAAADTPMPDAHDDDDDEEDEDEGEVEGSGDEEGSSHMMDEEDDDDEHPAGASAGSTPGGHSSGQSVRFSEDAANFIVVRYTGGDQVGGDFHDSAMGGLCGKEFSEFRCVSAADECFPYGAAGFAADHSEFRHGKACDGRSRVRVGSEYVSEIVVSM